MAIRGQVGGRPRHRPDTWHTMGPRKVVGLPSRGGGARWTPVSRRRVT